MLLRERVCDDDDASGSGFCCKSRPAVPDAHHALCKQNEHDFRSARETLALLCQWCWRPRKAQLQAASLSHTRPGQNHWR